MVGFRHKGVEIAAARIGVAGHLAAARDGRGIAAGAAQGAQVAHAARRVVAEGVPGAAGRLRRTDHHAMNIDGLGKTFIAAQGAQLADAAMLVRHGAAPSFFLHDDAGHEARRVQVGRDAAIAIPFTKAPFGIDGGAGGGDGGQQAQAKQWGAEAGEPWQHDSFLKEKTYYTF
ncbi:hypothetical protein D3C81_1681820 [compost metagenome]